MQHYKGVSMGGRRIDDVSRAKGPSVAPFICLAVCVLHEVRDFEVGDIKVGEKRW
jgi:hypothetical protein